MAFEPERGCTGTGVVVERAGRLRRWGTGRPTTREWGRSRRFGRPPVSWQGGHAPIQAPVATPAVDGVPQQTRGLAPRACARRWGPSGCP